MELRLMPLNASEVFSIAELQFDRAEIEFYKSDLP